MEMWHIDHHHPQDPSLDAFDFNTKWYVTINIPIDYQFILIIQNEKKYSLLSPSELFPKTIIINKPQDIRPSNGYLGFDQPNNETQKQYYWHQIILMAAKNNFYSTNGFIGMGIDISRSELVEISDELIRNNEDSWLTSSYEFYLTTNR